MCGFLGVFGNNKVDDFSSILSLLHHRGPDYQGFESLLSDEFIWGHARLSILDLENGNQPMYNSTKAYGVVFNGEIFNAPKLRIELEKNGFSFETKNSDTEVLLNMYIKYKEKMLDHIEGMFSFAILDKGSNTLFCARDRFGIKPFYYTDRQGLFAFSSEVRPLLRLPGVTDEISREALYHYMSLQFVPSSQSIFRDIQKLGAGEYLKFNLLTHEKKVVEYWYPRFDEEYSGESYAQDIKAKLVNAVSSWTLSDVPYAISLSGGLDSSVITGILSRETGQRQNTFSLGFKQEGEEGLFNEAHIAQRVAKHWGTNHSEVILDPLEFIDDLPKMISYLDEPYGGGLPSWFIYKYASKDYKVILNGTGGDELFGNYSKWLKYEKSILYKWRYSLIQLKYHSLVSFVTSSFEYPKGSFYHRYFSDSAKNNIIFTKDFLRDSKFSTEAIIENLWNKSNTTSARDAVPYIDSKMQLPEEFLYMTDRFSMAFSMEARVPFLDHKLAELLYSIPHSERTKPGDAKYLLKESAAEYLPEFLHSIPKRGFSLPLKSWTRTVLRDQITECLSPQKLINQGIFSESVWHKIVKPHLNDKADYTYQVWTLFMFQKWYENFKERK